MEHFINQIKMRTSLKALIGKDVRLVMRGREAVGLCPFHQEKTPSFHVIEEKQFYHCFGCGKSGTAIDWLITQKKFTFREAVTQLAEEAGLGIPKDLFQSAKANLDNSLYDVLQLASDYFQQNLQSHKGKIAQQYLQKRNVANELWHIFQLGFAGDSQDLKNFLAFMDARDISHVQLEQVGLLAYSEKRGNQDQIRQDQTGANRTKTGVPYLRFRNRLIFPILDKRGRVIAFGGRTLDGHTAKYLNSPETILFHKGSELYHQHRVHEAIKKGYPLIIAEGYMDVIQLYAHGFLGALAPLGTAMSEQQLIKIWQWDSNPYFCFDGDQAGIGAAYRVAVKALPLLRAGKTLHFCFLPENQDPDNVLENYGRQGFEKYLQQATPLGQMLFNHEVGQKKFTTPETRAGLEHNLMRYTQNIQDEIVRRHYRVFFKQALWQKFKNKPERKPFWRLSGNVDGTIGVLPQKNRKVKLYQILAMIFIYHPRLYPKFEEKFTLLAQETELMPIFSELSYLIEAKAELLVNEIAVSESTIQSLLGQLSPQETPFLDHAMRDSRLLTIFPEIHSCRDEEDVLEMIHHIFVQLNYYSTQTELSQSKRKWQEDEPLRLELDLAWQQAFDPEKDSN